MTLLVGLLTAIAGCGESGPKRGIVEGRVTLNGQPVDQAVLLFQSRALGVYMTAPTQPDGSYRIITADGAGLPIGTYEIAVVPRRPELVTGEPPPPAPPAEDIPPRYCDPATSGLTLEVGPTSNVFNVHMVP